MILDKIILHYNDNILGGSMHTIKKNTEALVIASNDYCGINLICFKI